MYHVTALDMQNLLIRMVGGNADPEMISDARQAIRTALRTVSAAHKWPVYHDFLHVLTSESYTTGTIVYTASTRTVVLTGGTWPSWALQGVIIIGTTHARVASVTNSTTLVVISDDAPPEDEPSTSYTLYQYQYTLPVNENIYRIGKIQVDQSNWLDYVPPGFFETDVRRQYLSTGGRPRWFTVQRDRQNPGQRLLSLWPYPTTVLRCRAGYVRHPRDILVWDYSTGQVATTASSTTVTGTSTAFVSNHVNCLLRTYSDRVNIPTNRDGIYPPVDEAVVDTVSSSTILTVKSALTTTQSDVSVSISDILDLDNTIMMDAVIYAARLHLCKLRRMATDALKAYEMDYQQALYLAQGQASTSNSVKIAGSFRFNNVGFPGLWDASYVLS